MIRISNSISIDERDISESFIRASGPGGQNVNKVSTAVELRYDVTNAILPYEVKQRLETVLLDLLAPIRARRAAWANRPDDVADILRDGTRHARGVT